MIEFNNPLLSIIIPSYNSYSYLERTIEEASKVYPSPEIIVVDDGSTDDTCKVCKHLEKKMFPILHVISQENAGVSAARNNGIRNARGKWLFFCDSDDWVDADGLSYLLRQAEQQSDGTIMLAAMNFVKQNGTFLHPVPDNVSFAPKDYLSSIKFQGSSCNHLFPRKLIIENDIMFPEGVVNTEDSNFNIKAISLCDKVYSVNISIYNYNHLNESAAHQTNRSLKWRVGPLESCIDLLHFCQKKSIPMEIVRWQINRLVEVYYKDHTYGKHSSSEKKHIKQLLYEIGVLCPSITSSFKFKVMTLCPTLGLFLLNIYNRRFK